MVFKLSPTAEAEIYWSEHKKHLDKLIEEKDELIFAIGSSTATGEIYTKIENCFKAAERIRSYGNSIPFHRAKKLEQAELAIGKIKKELQKQFEGYNFLESKIHGEVKRWHANVGKPQDKVYEEILTDCANYKNIERIAELLKVSGASGFYLEMAGVSALLSNTSYTAILSQYASSDSKEELQQAQQSLGKKVWQKVEAEKERLLRKYSGKLSKAETEFIKALPGKKWGELDAEMSKVVAHADEYLGKKKEIERETRLVQYERKELAALSVDLLPENLAKLTHHSIATRVFDDGGIVYLKERISAYQQEIKEREKVHTEKKKALEGRLVAEFSELRTAFEREEKLDSTILKSYERKAGELGQHYRQLGVDLTEICRFGDTLERVKSYPSLCSPVKKPEVISGEAIVKEKVVVQVSEERVVPILVPVEVAPLAPSVQPEVKPEIECNFPPIDSPLDLTNFAFDYRHQAGNKCLAKLCRQVTGLGDNDELLLVGFSERLSRINRGELTDLGAALSGKDVQAYRHLREGMEKYACDLT